MEKKIIVFWVILCLILILTSTYFFVISMHHTELYKKLLECKSYVGDEQRLESCVIEYCNMNDKGDLKNSFVCELNGEPDDVFKTKLTP